MTNLKTVILLSLVVVAFVSCSKKENVLTGDLYFVVTDASNYHVIDPDRRRAFKETALELSLQDSLDVEQQKLLSQYEFLKKNEVLDKPRIYINTAGGIKEVFVPLDDFKEIAQYSLQELRENNKRVYLELETEITTDGLLVAKEVFTIKETAGTTYYKQN